MGDGPASATAWDRTLCEVWVVEEYQGCGHHSEVRAEYGEGERGASYRVHEKRFGTLEYINSITFIECARFVGVQPPAVSRIDYRSRTRASRSRAHLRSDERQGTPTLSQIPRKSTIASVSSSHPTPLSPYRRSPASPKSPPTSLPRLTQVFSGSVYQVLDLRYLHLPQKALRLLRRTHGRYLGSKGLRWIGRCWRLLVGARSLKIEQAVKGVTVRFHTRIKRLYCY